MAELSVSKPQVSRAFTLIELLVILLTISLLIPLLIFGIREQKREVPRRECISNLKQVGLAYRIWDGPSYPQTQEVILGGSKEWLSTGQLSRHFVLLSHALSTPKVLVCPADKEKAVAGSFSQNFGNGNVSYFVNLDAQ